MTKIKKIITIITATFTMLFYKVGKVFAMDIPPADGIGSVPVGDNPSQIPNIIGNIGLILLAIVLPVLIVLEIVTLVKMKRIEKANGANANIDSESEKHKIVSKLKIITVLTIWITAIGILLLLIANDKTREYSHILYQALVISIMILPITVFLIKSVKILKLTK